MTLEQLKKAEGPIKPAKESKQFLTSKLLKNKINKNIYSDHEDIQIFSEKRLELPLGHDYQVKVQEIRRGIQQYLASRKNESLAIIKEGSENFQDKEYQDLYLGTVKIINIMNSRLKMKIVNEFFRTQEEAKLLSSSYE